MINQGKRNILGVQINVIDYDAVVAEVVNSATAKQGLSVSALAVHGVMTGALDPTHRFRLNKIDILTPDGQPVRWALNWLHNTNLTERVYGPNLMLKICEVAERQKLPIFLFGSAPETLNDLCQNLKILFPNILIHGSSPSQFRQLSLHEAELTINRIRDSGAAITFVGLGCPRQEVWVFENRDRLSMPLIAVGAAFDFHAGHLPQAPNFLQRMGGEWFFRFLQEPRRLWKRYLTLNPHFLWLVLLQKMGFRNFDSAEDPHPKRDLRFG